MRAKCSDILTELESWYATPNGRYLLDATRSAVRHLLDTTFGFHILQLGVRTPEPLSHGSPIHHRIYSASSSSEAVDLLAHPNELPLKSDSVDTVIAHHCLEFTKHPHETLREIQRVLTPQGRLILVGFNPWSLRGVSGRAFGAFRHPLWSAYRPLSESRLTDWLHLLGCEVQDSIHLYSVPVAGSGRVRSLLQSADTFISQYNIPIGGVFVLHATKQVVGVHPRRRITMGRRERLIGLVPKPSTAPSPATPAPGHGITYHKDEDTL